MLQNDVTPKCVTCNDCGRQATHNEWPTLIKGGWTLWFAEAMATGERYWFCPACTTRLVQ